MTLPDKLMGADFEGFKAEYFPREKILADEMQGALNHCMNGDARDRCRDAYYTVFKALEDEVRQKHGISGCLWEKRK